MDIFESIKQDKESDRVLEELKNQVVAPMNMMIAVGFGDALVTKDDEIIYSEINIELFNQTHEANLLPYWRVQDAENEARKDPDHEWTIDMQGPLQGETYKRMGEDNWVLIDSNKGFA